MTDIPSARSIKVLHCTGSPVDDGWADLSRLYARGALETLGSVGADGREYEHVIVDVAPNNVWRFPATLDDAALDSTEVVDQGTALAHLTTLGVDVAVPQMFCRPGLTAHRALLDIMRIPSIGNDATTMAITSDKSITRSIVAAVGIDVPAATLVRRGDHRRREELQPDAFPVVVKPVDGDNSTGVSFVDDERDLTAAIGLAHEQSDAALVERYVQLGREVRCGTIRRAGGDVVALPLEEYAVDGVSRPIRTAADKLKRDDGGDLHLVAKSQDQAWIVADDDPVVPIVQEMARRVHRALGCRHHGLIDVRIDPAGRPWFIEAGPYCSFAPSSVVIMMAAAAGISLGVVFDEAVDLVLAAQTSLR